ncbi:MAG: FAD-dependent thymidylate synthase [Sedimentisphaerales bacterium]|nr:FAD-dependent thymidylate synthase [Sedimentisphaerales bacterium]MBN2842385.1 FAD-dependent thymidylate synthase [Sedimentisphaerales bacterium]
MSNRQHIIEQKFGHQPEIRCLDHGFVRLIDCMPGLLPAGEDTADYAIAEAARCSYQRGTRSVNDDKALIDYLICNDHSSPLEMVEFKFHIKLPIFVARQLLRHRTASLNELSGRYSELPEEYYVPEPGELRQQSKTNKQGSEPEPIANAAYVQQLLTEGAQAAFADYHKCLNSGLARELARIALPLSTYTELYWKIDLKNLLHLLDLRCDEHAQKEIRVYAQSLLELITPIVPYTIAAWQEHSIYRGGMKLSASEVDTLKHFLADPAGPVPALTHKSKSRQHQWQEKLKRLGK